ncbi:MULTISPECIES: helix-turn-helix domain-containing protein [Robertmurraya]|uniref:Helix-turn-helix domain-containing protein n=1 Tax=Robertmurraya beringensis TaxID=641660 RepID=A0ABV6KVW8_9BACI
MLSRLVTLRKSRKWSMQETADRLEIAKSTYAGYEYGYREPSLQALSDIADLFETSVDHILGRSEQSLELTKLVEEESMALTLDGESLSKEEMIDFIAFTRIKREISTFSKKEA